MTEKDFDYEDVDSEDEDEDVGEYTRILLRNANKEDMGDLITFMNEHGIDWEIL